jgi:hypothetical protein
VPDEAVAGEAKGSYSQDFVGFVLTQRIANVLIEQALDDAKVKVTESDLQASEQRIEQAFQQAQASTKDLSTSFKKKLIHDLAVNQKFAGAFQDQDAAQAALGKVADKTDIEVSSRYGRWDAKALRIIPPKGASTPKGGKSTTTTTALSPGG